MSVEERIFKANRLTSVSFSDSETSNRVWIPDRLAMVSLCSTWDRTVCSSDLMRHK